MGVLIVCACLSALKPLAVGGLAIAPQTPYRRNNKQGLSLHQKSWVTKAGGRECVVATSFNLTPLEGWVNLGELVKDTRR